MFEIIVMDDGSKERDVYAVYSDETGIVAIFEDYDMARGFIDEGHADSYLLESEE